MPAELHSQRVPTIMQHNLPIPKQTTGQNQVKFLKCLYTIKDYPMRDAQTNGSNLRKLICGKFYMQMRTLRFLL